MIDGITWQGPFDNPSSGIVPDKIRVLKSGRWIISSHFLDREINKLVQYLWYSDDRGKTWSDAVIVAKDERYNLCETCIVEVEDNVLVAFLRENSWEGYDCFKAFSYDGGVTWDGVYRIPHSRLSQTGCRLFAGRYHTYDIQVHTGRKTGLGQNYPELHGMYI
ncbi:MAG: sialidase family protein [Clostridia bacterium]